jgi:hypothetical protein
MFKKPPDFYRRERYSGKYLPACRINQQGGVGEDFPRNGSKKGFMRADYR